MLIFELPALQNQIYEFLVNIGQIQFIRPDWVSRTLASKWYAFDHFFQKYANRMSWQVFDYRFSFWTPSNQFICRIINCEFDFLERINVFLNNIDTLFWSFWINNLLIFVEVLYFYFDFKLKAVFKFLQVLYFIKSCQLRLLFRKVAVLPVQIYIWDERHIYTNCVRLKLRFYFFIEFVEKGPAFFR